MKSENKRYISTQKEINDNIKANQVQKQKDEIAKISVVPNSVRFDPHCPDCDCNNQESKEYKAKLEQQKNEQTFETINSQLSFLKGKVLTVIDATHSDPIQRKAIKDLVHQQFYEQEKRIYEILTGNRMTVATGEFTK